MNQFHRPLLLCVALTCSTLPSFARRGMGENFRAEAMKQLDLSDEQKVELERIKAEKKDEVENLRSSKKELRKKFKEALLGESSDSELRKLHEKKQQLRQQLGRHRFERMLKVRKILTKDQRKKFHEIMDKNKSHRTRNH